MIQITYLSYKPIMQYIPKTLYGLTTYHSFVKYIAENGNYICVVDGKIVSKDEGNQIFKELKSKNPNSSVLAWRIPGKGEPGGLPSMGSHRVGHD